MHSLTEQGSLQPGCHNDVLLPQFVVAPPPPTIRTYRILDWVTFTHPGLPCRSPFDHYQAIANPEPQPNPHRFAQWRLGLSELAIEDTITQERSMIAYGKSTSPSVKSYVALLRKPQLRIRHKCLPNRIVSKEDCVHYFRPTGRPTTSALLGVYRWATNLGTSQFNFDIDFDTHSLSMLNAYD